MSVWRSKKAIFGQMYIDVEKELLFTAPADVFHQLTGLSRDTSKFVGINEVAGEFIIQQQGYYKFNGVASLYPSAGMEITFALFVNDTKVDFIETSINFKNNQDKKTFSGTGIIWANKNDKINVRGATDTVPVTLTIRQLNLNIRYVGQ